MVPTYGDEKAEFQVAKGEIRVDLPPCGAYVFEVDTPNIIEDSEGRVFKQKTE